VGFSDFLQHRCDIYHIQREDKSPGYNLPSSPTFSYPEEPDLENVSCHFGTKSSTVNVVQQEPQMVYEARIKLALPWGTDIRVNDKIIDCETGYEYTAEIPRKHRNHHLTVMVTRRANQEAL
jgi:hypothetical protein